MTTTKLWVGLLSSALAAAGIMTAASGCKMLNKGESDESAAEDTAAAEEEPPPEPEPTSEATAEATADEAAEDAGAEEGEIGDDEVKEYPNQIPASGTYVLLKSFNVYQAADIESKRLGGVGRGTIIRLKATLGNWMLIKWPAAPGEMKPGWIKVRLSQRQFIDKTDKEPDAGKPPEPKPDAGKPAEKPRDRMPVYKKPASGFKMKKKK